MKKSTKRVIRAIVKGIVAALTALVCGHRDLPGVKKACPCFNASAEYEF